MGLVSIDGKEVALDDLIIDAGDVAIRAALAADFPDTEDADIQIVRPAASVAASSVRVSQSRVSVVKKSSTLS